MVLRRSLKYLTVRTFISMVAASSHTMMVCVLVGGEKVLGEYTYCGCAQATRSLHIELSLARSYTRTRTDTEEGPGQDENRKISPLKKHVRAHTATSTGCK